MGEAVGHLSLSCQSCTAGSVFSLIQEFHRLQEENFQLKTICEDQEQALEELGSKLSEYVFLIKESLCGPFQTVPLSTMTGWVTTA